MHEHTIRGERSAQRGLAWARELRARGYQRKRDWDWCYHPSQQAKHKRAVFRFRDPRILTLLLLRDPRDDQ